MDSPLSNQPTEPQGSFYQPPVNQPGVGEPTVPMQPAAVSPLPAAQMPGVCLRAAGLWVSHSRVSLR